MGTPKIAIETDSAAALPRTAHPLAVLAAQFIPGGARVAEIGTSLGEFLPHGCVVASSPADADIIVALGVLEAAEGRDGLFGQLALSRRPVIVNYSPCDLAGDSGNNRLGLYELTQLFDRFGFRVECSIPLDGGEMLMRLAPAEKLAAQSPPRIAVLSLGDAGTFGERLGYHMIHAVLPGAADIAHLTPAALAGTHDIYDLVVVGTGNSLSPAALTDELFAALARAKAAIGIFGTRYRPLIPRAALDRLLERCDTWFARHEEDVLIFGKGRRNAVHLGDWRIDQCSLGRACEDEPLDIGAERLRAMTADAAIEMIRRHRSVLARDPAALLCALTAADVAAYAGEPEENRGLLIDIFGRGFPEGESFLVDRDAVARYKARVRENVGMVRDRIASALRANAAAAAA